MRSRIKLDYDLCMAIGKDAGNRNMRKHNRNAWNIDDWNVAAETANKLLLTGGVYETYIPRERAGDCPAISRRNCIRAAT